MDARQRDGETLLVGTLPDQAALFGVLAQVEALGLELLEVRRDEHRRCTEEAGQAASRCVRDAENTER
jgi:hypothetical protein